ncbi:MAG TPA: sialidase family protein, partial [Candidatus Hydrogenedentes bacterium]|nr:sialidase family protein [Candidatus Hydrogenedentota bacterium]
MNRVAIRIVVIAVFAALCVEAHAADAPSEDVPRVSYELQLDTIRSGYDGETCWVHARAGAIPAEPPIVVLTMQKLLLSGSDVFFALNEMRSDDFGVTWTDPVEHDTLGRRAIEDGAVEVVCDFAPKWHAATGKILGTGHSAQYRDNKLVSVRTRCTAYSVYDPENRTWTPWKGMEMPDDERFYNAGAGCTQRIDLPNGDILLPVYFKAMGEKQYAVTVLRCRFDGQTLSYIEHGNELTVAVQRGFAEPSLA